jgi:hypothetical protein
VKTANCDVRTSQLPVRLVVVDGHRRRRGRSTSSTGCKAVRTVIKQANAGKRRNLTVSVTSDTDNSVGGNQGHAECWVPATGCLVPVDLLMSVRRSAATRRLIATANRARSRRSRRRGSCRFACSQNWYLTSAPVMNWWADQVLRASADNVEAIERWAAPGRNDASSSLRPTSC